MKNVLFVTYDFPYPTNTGGKNRAYNMLKHSKGDFKKYLFSFIRPDFKKEYIDSLKDIDVETVGLEKRKRLLSVTNAKSIIGGESIFKNLYFSPKIAQKIEEIVRDKEINIIHFESFYTAFYISDTLTMLGAKQVYGSENIEYKMYEDYTKTAPLPFRPFYKSQVRKILNEEIWITKKADRVIAVSNADAEYFDKYNKCDVVRNGVDVENFPFNKPRKNAKNILFVGNFSYFPNVDAINFFYNQVFSQMTIDAQLTIVGKRVEDLKIDDNRVEKIEFIPEISDAYKQADVVVSPVKLGGGTNFKVLEAFAAGVPVVSFPDRVQGLDIKNGENILIANDAAEFMIEIEKLFSDEKLREKIATNARKLVEREYDWKVIGKYLSKSWNEI